MANDYMRETLETARALIADPARWTRGALRQVIREPEGGSVRLTEKLCAIGAVLKALGMMRDLEVRQTASGLSMFNETPHVDQFDVRLREARLYLDDAIDRVPVNLQPQCFAWGATRANVEGFNDGSSHTAVMALFDIAIKDAINEADFDE